MGCSSSTLTRAQGGKKPGKTNGPKSDQTNPEEEQDGDGTKEDSMGFEENVEANKRDGIVREEPERKRGETGHRANEAGPELDTADAEE